MISLSFLTPWLPAVTSALKLPGQEAAQHGAGAAEGGGVNIGEIIMHHITDSPVWETPFGAVHLPQFDPVQLGPLAIDFSITKHVLFLFFAAVITAAVLIGAGRHARKRHAAGASEAPRGTANVVEAMVLYFRDEVALANIGHGGARYVPLIIGLFFFILFANLLGLLPWGATPTGNLSVTAALAVISLVVIEVSGMLALGFRGYLGTIFFAPEDMHPAGKAAMMLIMTPIEVIGKFTKGFALAIRLFANMIAGHMIILLLVGLVLLALPAAIAVIPGPIIIAIGIAILEVLIALIQAYIFAALTATFIGLIRAH